MNKKTINRINGGIAIYYGISAVIGAIIGLISICAWLFKIIINQAEFTWTVFTILILITAVSGMIGYIILRVGYEDIEK